MRITFILGIIVMACVAACVVVPPPSGGPGGGREPLATLERTACFGFCPIYKVTIFRDGVVVYEGVKFVKTVGTAIGRLNARQLDRLRALFEQNDYFQLADSYQSLGVTDLPSAITSYSPRRGLTKTVNHYQGDRTAPPRLRRIEDGIDRIVDIEQWIGAPDERPHT
jgi:Domain of unknown function (DUF6438)